MLHKLYIEPTTNCNLNCKMCFRHTWFDEPSCDLSMEELRKALDTMPSSVETIFFGGMGEPLFHRDILEMVRLAAGTGAEVELLTNGTLLSEQMIRGLIDAGLGKLWVSIDDLQTDSSIDGSGHDHAGQVLSNIRCGHCELFAENREDCIGNTHPTCGGCLWAEGVLSCP